MAAAAANPLIGNKHLTPGDKMAAPAARGGHLSGASFAHGSDDVAGEAVV